jgi:hypothetical protein
MILFSHREYPLDTHVSNFPISVRARNSIRNMGASTLRELLCIDTDKWYGDDVSIPNCGSQTRIEIQTFARMCNEEHTD